MSYGGHPTRRQIEAYAERRSSVVDQLWIAEHLGNCNNCYFTLRSVMPTPALSPKRVEYPPPVAERGRPFAEPVSVPVSDSAVLWRGSRSYREVSPGTSIPGLRGPLMGRGLSSPPIVHMLFDAAVRCLPDEHQDRYDEEWRADLRQIHSRWWAICWALQIRFYSARSLRRLYRNTPSKEAL